MVVVVIIFRLISPADLHSTMPYNIIKMVILVSIVLAIRRIFRCPNCNNLLIQDFYSTFWKLHKCSECGVSLSES